jgi:hypothetical protein
MDMEAIPQTEVSRMNGPRFSLLLVLGIALTVIVLDGCSHELVIATKGGRIPSPPPPPPPPPAASHTPPPRAAARPPSGDHRPTGRSWLVGNLAEPPGYGLYSYLLFGSLPSDATRPLYVAVIKASLSKVEPIERELQSFSPAQLNLYLMPLLSEPPRNAQPDDLANWIVDNYNYPRAEKILASLPERKTGVYILSVLSKPVDPSHALQPPYLWQDLSNVEPRIVVAWVQFFLDQAAKGRPWEESMGDKLALDLRNNIEQVAVQMQAAIPAMVTAIKWFKPGS